MHTKVQVIHAWRRANHPDIAQNAPCNNYISHLLLISLPFDLRISHNNLPIMAIARIRSRLSTGGPAQPPSPMPNSRPTRNDPSFNNYVDKLKNIPEFDTTDDSNRPPIAEVEYKLIKAKDKNSIQQMMESAAKFGMFRVSGHGISPEELNAAFTEADFIFGLLAERWSRDGDREEFAWSRSAMAVAERRRDVKNDENFLKFRFVLRILIISFFIFRFINKSKFFHRSIPLISELCI